MQRGDATSHVEGRRAVTLMALACAVAVMAGLLAPASAAGTTHPRDGHGLEHRGRRPLASAPASRYDDPCENETTVDLRWVEIGDLLEDDRRTVRTGDIPITVILCDTIPDDRLTPVRVDLFPRNDGSAGPDYSETPSRSLVITPSGSTATWALRSSSGTVASGQATLRGSAGSRIGYEAEVPACTLAEASGGRCGSDRRLLGTPPGPLPPLALRACSRDVDCGPSYQTVNGTTSRDPSQSAADTDYLPSPRYFQLTYPSVCQVGGVMGYSPSSSPDVVHWKDPTGQGVRRASSAPNDPWFSTDGPGAPTGQWSLRRIHAPGAWPVTRADNVRVAVIDSGFDGRHPDLRGRAIAVKDFVPTRDGGTGGLLDRGADTDLNGHGSFIASQIGARTDDGVGMAGIAPRVNLLMARVFDAEGCASDGAIIEAVRWAVNSGAAVVNLSLGGPAPAEPLAQIGRWAEDRGTVMVAAAGNAGSSVTDFPAGYDAFVSVGATAYVDPDSSADDPIAPYSNHNDSIELVAPGGSGFGASTNDVLGACWKGPFEQHGWCRFAGTSFAAPLVSAVVALVTGEDPGRTVEGIRELLRDTARDLSSRPGTRPGRDDYSGFGRVDAENALTILNSRQETLRSVTGTRDATAASIAVSREVFATRRPGAAVLARRDVFADALSGAPLAGAGAPVLLTGRDRLDPRVADELRRVLSPGARVWLLGGTAALAPGIEADLRALGFSPARIWGRTRYETAAAIARRVGLGPDGRVLVASGANWPDAISGGLYAAANGVPLLLSSPGGATPDRSPGLLDTLRRLGPREIVLLGGTAALSPRVATDVSSIAPVRRIAGPDRYDTAARVVTDLWGRRAGSAGDAYVVVNAQVASGWTFGLSAAPLAATREAPLLLVQDDFFLQQPEQLLRHRLQYRITKPAMGFAVGPVSYSEPVVARTIQRLRELLGG